MDFLRYGTLWYVRKALPTTLWLPLPFSTCHSLSSSSVITKRGRLGTPYQKDAKKYVAHNLKVFWKETLGSGREGMRGLDV